MCLTNVGKTFPEEELCGAHGTCLEGVCVCDTNWGNSIDLAPVLALNQGAREIFENATVNSTSITVQEFESLFINSSPCSRMIPVRNFMYSINLLFSILATFYFIRNMKTKADLNKRLPQVISFIPVMIDSVLKIVYQEKVSFPFSFFPSLIVGSLIVYFQLSIYNFYCKYTKYHLSKARQKFGLEVKFLGTFFVPPILIQSSRIRNEFDFNLFLIAYKLIIAQWIVGSLIVYY
eukprot:snap_masked-scaffold_22-processed-gene-4.19-mRNA-1 protein AED:1.00 eAED:1.00 QI:0/0/0/0/1/1/3/0/233